MLSKRQAIFTAVGIPIEYKGDLHVPVAWNAKGRQFDTFQPLKGLMPAKAVKNIRVPEAGLSPVGKFEGWETGKKILVRSFLYASETIWLVREGPSLSMAKQEDMGVSHVGWACLQAEWERRGARGRAPRSKA
jgi:hypothetical protein